MNQASQRSEAPGSDTEILQPLDAHATGLEKDVSVWVKLGMAPLLLSVQLVFYTVFVLFVWFPLLIRLNIQLSFAYARATFHGGDVRLLLRGIHEISVAPLRMLTLLVYWWFVPSAATNVTASPAGPITSGWRFVGEMLVGLVWWLAGCGIVHLIFPDVHFLASLFASLGRWLNQFSVWCGGILGSSRP